MAEQKFSNLNDFWPFYLNEHKNSLNRQFHIAGTTLAIVFAVIGLLDGQWFWLFLALLSGYGPAWTGHFFLEKNRPATFKHPLYSFCSDFRMTYCFYAGKLESELLKHGVFDNAE